MGRAAQAETFYDEPKGDGAKKVADSILTEELMKLTAPKPITFWVAVVIAVLGVIAKLVTIPVLSGYPGWLLLIAFVILALGVLIEGL